MICHVFKRGRFYWGKLRLDGETSTAVFSLTTTDSRVAQAELAEKTKEREKELIYGLPAHSRKASRKPLSEHLAVFLADVEAKGRAAHTLKKYSLGLPKLFERCGWNMLGQVSVRSFCEWRAGCGLWPKTVNDALMNARTFFRWLVHQRIAVMNPLEHVQLVDNRLARQYRRALSQDEARRLLEAAPANRSLVYLAAMTTGLRRNELKQLRWGDFNLVGSAPSVRVPASISKNRKESCLPLTAELLAALLAHRLVDAASFQPVFARVPAMPSFRRDIARAGLAYIDESGRHLDFHSLRMTYGTSLSLSGAAPRTVMELMRHSDIKLTMRIYTDASQLPLAEAVARLPKFSGNAKGAESVHLNVHRNVHLCGSLPVAKSREAS